MTTNATRLLAVLLLVSTFSIGCGSSADRDDPILRLSADESLAEGKRLMELEKYNLARQYLTHAFEVEPNSVSGREALLLSADALFLDGGRTHLIQSEAKYRDFLNRFPTSQRSDYVQYQIANTLLGRMEKADRDQSIAQQAKEAYQELLTLYPTSEYVEEARAKMAEVDTNLAEHEFLVGKFYLRFRLPAAAVARFEYLLENYPNYAERDKAYYHLGLAYRQSKKPDEAASAFQRLREEHPESRYLEEIKPLPQRAAAPPSDEQEAQ